MKISRGFSLVEMAVVLLIVGLLLGGLLMPLNTQMEQRRIAETEQKLKEIQEAMIGFAVANGRLPKPATSAVNGIEQVANCVAPCTGFIPWATLGVSQFDSWNKLIRYSVTPAFANQPITLPFIAANFPNKSVQTRDGAGAAVYLVGQANCALNNVCAPAVIFSHGSRNFGTTANGSVLPNDGAGNIDEINNNNAVTTNFFSRTINPNAAAAGGEFDDIVTWIPLGVLLNRMVTAGTITAP